MEHTENKSFVKEVLLMFIASVLLSRLSIGIFVFTLPLLLIAPKIKKTSNAVLLTIASSVAVLAWNLVDYKEYLSSPQTFGVLGFGLFFPVCLAVVASVWIGLRDFSRLVLRKLVICSFPVILLSSGCAIWLSSSKGLEAYTYLQNYVIQLFPAVFGEQIDLKMLSQVFMTVLLIAVSPMGLTFGSIPVLISEFLLNKQDKEWQDNFSNMSMPPVFFWFTMLGWILALSGTLFLEYPVWLTILVWNFALSCSLYYLLAGISIICAKIRKKIPEAKASKICLICMIACLLPGTNLIAVLGLPVLGLLETWISLR